MHGILGYMEENYMKVVGTIGRLLGKSRGYDVHGFALQEQVLTCWILQARYEVQKAHAKLRAAAPKS